MINVVWHFQALIRSKWGPDKVKQVLRRFSSCLTLSNPLFMERVPGQCSNAVTGGIYTCTAQCSAFEFPSHINTLNISRLTRAARLRVRLFRYMHALQYYRYNFSCHISAGNSDKNASLGRAQCERNSVFDNGPLTMVPWQWSLFCFSCAREIWYGDRYIGTKRASTVK